MYKGKACVPKDLVENVIGDYHRAAHASFVKTLLLLKRSFHFPLTDKELSSLCEHIVRRCQVCQAVKKKNNTRNGTLDYVPIPEDIFSCVCMDFLELPACVDNAGEHFDYVLVIVCRLSGYVLGIPCRKAGLTAEKMANIYLRNAVAIFGLPHEIMSDCDHLINSKFMNTLCALAGVTQHTSIVYRPRGNGRAETGVRLVIEMLRRALAEGHVPWVQALPWALWQLNDLPGVDGSHSPHMIVFGREPIGLGDAPAFRHGRHAVTAEDWFDKLDKLRREVQQRVTQIHQQHSERYLRKHKNIVYEPGDRVWVRNLPHEGNKLDPLWTGPCEVLGRVGNTGRYQIAMTTSVQDVHSERLKMYLPMVHGERVRLHYYKPQHDVPEDDSMVVEAIIGHRVRGGKHQWRVRWKGYDESFDSWEPAASFVGYLQQDWLQYNREHHLNIPVGHLVEH